MLKMQYWCQNGLDFFHSQLFLFQTSICCNKQTEECVMKAMFLILLLLSTSVFANFENPRATFNLESGSKVIDLGLLKADGDLLKQVNYSLNLVRTKNSIKKVKIRYKMEFLRKKCVDYDIKKVMRPKFSQDVCTAVGDGSFQCENKSYDQLYEAKVICIEKGMVKATAEKSLTVSFKSAAALSTDTKEVFMINITQSKLTSKKVKVSGSIVESPVQYKVKGVFLGDGVSFKVVH